MVEYCWLVVAAVVVQAAMAQLAQCMEVELWALALVLEEVLA